MQIQWHRRLMEDHYRSYLRNLSVGLIVGGILAVALSTPN